MKIIEPSYKLIAPDILNKETRERMLSDIANAAAVCYQSHPADNAALVKHLVKSGHEAMLEHSYISAQFVTDRGVSHEIVRHRLASFAQESTRYCNYSKGRFGNKLTFIRPQLEDKAYDLWLHSCNVAEHTYFAMVNDGIAPELARCVLPTSIKTTIVVTANLREWRHIFRLRVLGTTGKPHPDIRRLFEPLYEECRMWLPEVFEE